MVPALAGWLRQRARGDSQVARGSGGTARDVVGALLLLFLLGSASSLALLPLPKPPRLRLCGFWTVDGGCWTLLSAEVLKFWRRCSSSVKRPDPMANSMARLLSPVRTPYCLSSLRCIAASSSGVSCDSIPRSLKVDTTEGGTIGRDLSTVRLSIYSVGSM